MTSRIPFAEVPADAPIHNNLVRAAYNNPEMFRGFGSLSMRVHTASGLSDRLREVVVLRTVARLGADYEWGNHVIAATKLGMSKSEIRSLREGDVTGFDEQERVAIAFAEAVEDRTVDDALWEKASTWFTPAQLADLTMLVGFYGLASRFVMALGVPLDEGVAGLESP